MPDTRNTLRGTILGNRAYGGDAPQSFYNPISKKRFYGRLEKDAAGQLCYAVWSVAEDGTIEEWFRRVNCGRGSLAVDCGYLVVTLYGGPGDGVGATAQAIAVTPLGWPMVE